MVYDPNYCYECTSYSDVLRKLIGRAQEVK